MIGGVGGFNPTNFAVMSGLSRQQNSQQTSSQTTLTGGDMEIGNDKSAETEFLNYMKETPAQRMEDAWLKAHGLTKEKLAAMAPKDREAVMRQMEKEIEDSLKRQTQAKAKVDITV